MTGTFSASCTCSWWKNVNNKVIPNSDKEKPHLTWRKTQTVPKAMSAVRLPLNLVQSTLTVLTASSLVATLVLNGANSSGNAKSANHWQVNHNHRVSWVEEMHNPQAVPRNVSFCPMFLQTPLVMAWQTRRRSILPLPPMPQPARAFLPASRPHMFVVHMVVSFSVTFPYSASALTSATALFAIWPPIPVVTKAKQKAFKSGPS